MATESKIAFSNVAPIVQRTHAGRFFAAIPEYWALTKPDVNFLILITTFSGFYLALGTKPHGFPGTLALHTLVGTLLMAGGAGTLNQFIERSFDAQMRRTARRPLASGRLKASHVFWFGIASSVAGTVYLALAVNVLGSLLAVVTLLSYLFLYTRLKRKTPLCTLIGAFSGAVPPLIGWAAARGRLDLGAWVLYALVFLWQFPHFMAIAWMYREDYARAGYQILPPGKRRDGFATWQSLAPSLALLAVSFVPAITGESGLVYSAGAVVFSLIFLCYSALFVFHRSNVAARRLLTASIVYLPAVFILLVLSRK
jgi:protoheme IX farnesyltransferase